MEMTIQALKKLVRQGEGQELEFKKKANHPEKIVKEVVAFANAKGGRLLIGVDDFGGLAGCRYPEEEAFVLERAFDQMIFPALPMYKSYITLDNGFTVIIYDIPEGVQKPYKVKTAEHAKVYIRQQDRSIQASGPLKEILRRRAYPKNIQFEVGPIEKQLLVAVEENNSITVAELSELASISKKMAAKRLITLVLANVLEIIPQETGDLYVLSNKAHSA
ncbi:ATP-binding protein [Persicobacter psychrovividus]|uniref:ATP-dependent DNA helicase n=1 Tax=Persicobacter psychrovividus TaxID=387638 RepID=A0ABN6LAI7_9BACT|nr:ATP-dependent DNA helicase [Persicobacter psychrovividus]